MWEFDGNEVDGHAALLALTTARQRCCPSKFTTGLFYRSLMEQCRTLSYVPSKVNGYLCHRYTGDTLKPAELSATDKLLAHVFGTEASMFSLSKELIQARKDKLIRIKGGKKHPYLSIRTDDNGVSGVFASSNIEIGKKIIFGLVSRGQPAAHVKHSNPYVWSDEDLYCNPLDKTNKTDHNFGMFINYGDVNANVEQVEFATAGEELVLTVIKPVEEGEQLLWNYYSSDHPLPEWYIPTYGEHSLGLTLFKSLLVRLQYVDKRSAVKTLTCPDDRKVKFSRNKAGNWKSNTDWLLRSTDCDKNQFFIQKGLNAYVLTDGKWEKIVPDAYVTESVR